MPKIIKISGLYELPKEIKSQNISERFEYIYKTGVWNKEQIKVGVENYNTLIIS